MTALIVIAAIFGFLGLLFHSEATRGVAFIAFACLLAIFARIAQAERHRDAGKQPSQARQLSPAERDTLARAEKRNLAIAIAGFVLVFIIVIVGILLR